MPRPRRTQAEIADRREQLISAATDLIHAMPYARIEMAAVATATGLNRRTIYDEYRQKESLFAAVLLGEWQRFCAAVVKAMVPFNEEKLRQLLIRYASHEPGFTRLGAVLFTALLPALRPPERQRFRREAGQILLTQATALDDGVAFFMVGDGAGFLVSTANLLAHSATRLDWVAETPLSGKPALQTVTAARPEWAVRMVLFTIAGMRRQANRRANALAANRLPRWGSAEP